MKKIVQFLSALTVITITLSGNLFAGSLYWIGGSGNWSDATHWSNASGGSSCTCIPTATDDIFFDANSFSGNAQIVTVDAAAYCHSMDWSSITKTSIQMSGTSDLHISGSLTMKSTMVVSNYTGALYFEGTNVGNTITSAGKTFTSPLYFNGNGGEWTLQDAFVTTGDITLNYGTLITNNKNLTCNTFNSNNNNVRGFTLGSSTVTLTYTSYWTWTTGGSNFAFDAGTSTIKMTAASSLGIIAGTNDVFYDVLFQQNTSIGYVNGGLSFHNVTFSGTAGTIAANNGTSFHKVIFNGDGNLNNNAVYDSLIFSAGKTYTLESNKTQTINTYLKADGTCALPIILHPSNIAQATISQATGTVTISYVELHDIDATGGATFTGNFTSNLGNNTGWTIPSSPTDLYWIGGSGNWNSPTHWSTTGGGSAACVIPNSSTNVHFIASSFTGNGQVVTMNTNAYCNNMDWSAITQTSIQMSGTSDLHISGSLIMKSTMVISNYTGALYFEGTNAGNTITSAGKAFTSSLYFNGNGGEWTLQDAFVTTGDITLNYGTLITNNKNLTCNTFNSVNNNARGVTLGASTVTLTYTSYWNWNTGGSNFALDAGTSTIKMTAASSLGINAGTNDVFYDVLFQQNTSIGYVNGGLSFHNITFNGTSGSISASNGTSFHKVIFNGDGNLNNNAVYDSLIFSAGKTYTLESNKTQTINTYLKADGTCALPIILHSNSIGAQATISQATGTVTISYVVLQDIGSTGGATFAGSFTSNLGNNTGWTISSPTDLYWIGGSGNWNSPTHWSTTSGGATACIIPNSLSNVHFDENSFSSNAQTVTINVNAYCKNMNWSALTQTSVQMSGSSDLHIYGSLTMKNTMIISNYTGALYFEGTNAGNTITSAGKAFTSLVNFNGNGGEWTLQDAFVTTGDITLNYGTLITNNKNLTCNTFNSNNSNVRGLTLGSSMVTLTYASYWTWNTGGSNFALDAGTSMIKMTAPSSSLGLLAGANDVLYDVLFQQNTSIGYIQGGLSFHNIIFNGTAGTISANNGTSFHKVFFNGDGNLNNNAVYDSLIFSEGKTYTLEYNKTQTINTYFKVDGSCGQNIILKSNSVGTQATINKAVGAVILNYVSLKDVNFTGGATFTANNTTDLGNTTGITINLSAPVISAYTSSQNGLTTNFTNTSTGATSYKWNFGDGATSVQQNPVHTYNLGGSFNVCLIAYNSCGTSDTICNNVNPGCSPPVANYTATVSGLKVSFNNTSTNAASVLWKFGDATSSTALNAVHTFFNAGTYTVSLVINNGCGRDSIFKTVSVTCAPPVASYFYSVNGMTVNFTNISSNAATSNWSFGDTYTSTQNSPSRSYNAAGTYVVKLKITNGCGSDSVTQSVPVVCSSPVSSFISSPQGLKVDFVSTSKDATTVAWYFGDGSPVSILPFVNHTYTTTATYTVCLVSKNGCGKDSACNNVSVCLPPTAGFTYTVSALNVTFKNTSTNGTKYLWNLGDGNASSMQNPTHNYKTSASYSVCLEAENTCGQNTSCSSVLTVCSPYSTIPICLVTVDPVSSRNRLVWEKPITTAIDSFRIFREVQSNFSKIASVPYSGLSEFTDLTSGVNPGVTSYKYKLALVDTCGNESALSSFHRTMHLSVSPASPWGYNLSWNDYIGLPVTQYRIWRDITGKGKFQRVDSVSFGNNAWTDSFHFSGTDTVWYYVEIDHQGACVSSLKTPQALAVNLNSSKSNVYRIADTTVVGIPGLTDNYFIAIYPNPSEGMFTLELNNDLGQGEILIFNMVGDKVKQFSVIDKSQKLTIDLRGFARGIYHLKYLSGQQVIYKKIVIQ